MNSVIASLTGLFDTDMVILQDVDLFSLIDIYRTNSYTKNLLNSRDFLNILSNQYDLERANSFAELINNYENKIAMTFPFDEAFAIAVDYDNVYLVNKILNRMDLNNLNVMKRAVINSLEKKSYRVLKILASYLINIAYVYKQHDDMFNFSDIFGSTLEHFVKSKDYESVKIILSWLIENSLELDPDILKKADTNWIINKGLSSSAYYGDIDMFDYLLSFKDNGLHHDVDLIRSAIWGRPSNNTFDGTQGGITKSIMIRHMADTYDIANYPNLHIIDYRKMMRYIQDLEDKDLQNYLTTFASKFIVNENTNRFL
jgi:hypothetical protein